MSQEDNAEGLSQLVVWRTKTDAGEGVLVPNAQPHRSRHCSGCAQHKLTLRHDDQCFGEDVATKY
jgi:hypothetical protein